MDDYTPRICEELPRLILHARYVFLSLYLDIAA